MVALRERTDVIEEDAALLLVLAEANGRATRRDALPEHTQYNDTGCDLHAGCLTCPLVRCRYDEPGGARKLLSEDRDRSILALRHEGRQVEAIAQRFGVSRRTVFRVLANARQRDAAPKPRERDCLS